jgi:hypothetical protein
MAVAILEGMVLFFGHFRKFNLNIVASNISVESVFLIFVLQEVDQGSLLFLVKS